MSETLLEEMLRRARHLAMTRGQRRDVDLHDWMTVFRQGRIHCAVREDDDKVMISLREESGRLCNWIYFIDMDRESDSLYKPECYEEATSLMRGMMVLDDLADV